MTVAARTGLHNPTKVHREQVTDECMTTYDKTAQYFRKTLLLLHGKKVPLLANIP